MFRSIQPVILQLVLFSYSSDKNKNTFLKADEDDCTLDFDPSKALDVSKNSSCASDRAARLTLFVKSESPNKEKRHVNCILCSQLNASLSSVYSLFIT